MRVTVLGASGFIGQRLVAALRARGDDVVELSLRDPEAAAAASAGSDVVVNLAGAPISVRWTPAVKDALKSTRVDLPRRYLAALAGVAERPKAYVSASAVGYYGTSRSATFVETSPPGDDFLAGVCVAWEAGADAAATLGMRVTKLRTGLVLGSEGGALAMLFPVFRLGLGGPVGDGGQWYSWIHADDAVGIILHAIDGVDGVLNAVAPKPVTSRDFSRALGQVVHRPAFLPTPAFVTRLMLGEGAIIVNEGQRVLPQRTLASGYIFRHPDLAEALSSLLA
jgi:uncharacterized protein (TIGR01777 family)